MYYVCSLRCLLYMLKNAKQENVIVTEENNYKC